MYYLLFRSLFKIHPVFDYYLHITPSVKWKFWNCSTNYLKWLQKVWMMRTFELWTFQILCSFIPPYLRFGLTHKWCTQTLFFTQKWCNEKNTIPPFMKIWVNTMCVGWVGSRGGYMWLWFYNLQRRCHFWAISCTWWFSRQILIPAAAPPSLPKCSSRATQWSRR